MKKHYLKAKIVKNHQIAPEHFELILKAPQIANAGRPGNFVQIKADDSLNPLLPRPFGLSDVDTKKGEINLIYKTVGQGTEILSKRKVGDKLMIIGSLGNNFWLEKNVKRIAIVAGGTGIGPCLFLTKNFGSTHREVGLYAFLGARTKKLLLGQKKLSKHCEQLFISTDDGSQGHHGFVTDILEKKCREFKIDQIIAVGPMPMMKKTVAIAQKLKIPSQVSLEERMACGFGICLGCSVKLKDNQYHTICCDGPVFSGDDVMWI